MSDFSSADAFEASALVACVSCDASPAGAGCAVAAGCSGVATGSAWVGCAGATATGAA